MILHRRQRRWLRRGVVRRHGRLDRRARPLRDDSQQVQTASVMAELRAICHAVSGRRRHRRRRQRPLDGAFSSPSAVCATSSSSSGAISGPAPREIGRPRSLPLRERAGGATHAREPAHLPQLGRRGRRRLSRVYADRVRPGRQRRSTRTGCARTSPISKRLGSTRAWLTAKELREIDPFLNYPTISRSPPTSPAAAMPTRTGRCTGSPRRQGPLGVGCSRKRRPPDQDRTAAGYQGSRRLRHDRNRHGGGRCRILGRPAADAAGHRSGPGAGAHPGRGVSAGRHNSKAAVTGW